MKSHYDFSKMKGRKNPYIKYLKQPVTVNLDRNAVEYFKSLAEESGMPYQTLINWRRIRNRIPRSDGVWDSRDWLGYRWGAWLNPAEDKRVIAPARWFTPDVLAACNALDLYPDDWTLLK